MPGHFPLELPGFNLEGLLEGPPASLATGVLLPPGPVLLRRDRPAWRYYAHGWHSWCPAGWVDPLVPPAPMQPPERRPQGCDPLFAESSSCGGSGVGALSCEGRVLLLGALGPGARVESNGWDLAGHYEGEPSAWFLTTGDEATAFWRYTETLQGALGGARGRPQRCGPVWCSWYGRYRDIDEETLRADLEGLGDLPFEVFQVDDGWQVSLGEWRPGPRFPSGMESLAGAIRATGRRAGLWLAPFLVHPDSGLFRDHPEWLLRDSLGDPVSAGPYWGTEVFCLDTTLPDVGDWLVERVREVLSWGFDYLKLDFLYAAAMPGVRSLPVGREQALRDALSRIRSAAGDAYLLACGCPILPCLGLVDGLRVGPDTAGTWQDLHRTEVLADPSGPCAQNALRTSLHRLWLKPLVQVDPDVAWFRNRESALTPEQRAVTRDLARVAGFLSASDPPGWLAPEELEDLRRFLEEDLSPVTPLGGYRYDLGGREVDFGPWL